jgi:hypothetical protein
MRNWMACLLAALLLASMPGCGGYEKAKKEAEELEDLNIDIPGGASTEKKEQ